MRVNVIVPAAGLATRMRPLTNTVSKAMLPVNGQPAFEYIYNHLMDHYEVEQLVVVDGALPDLRNRYGNHCTFIQQSPVYPGPLGAIHTGLIALEEVDVPLVVWLGDTIVLDAKLPFGTNFLLVADKEDQSEWCMTDGQQFIDKPQADLPDTFKALVGVYGFDKTSKVVEAFGGCVGESEISALLYAFHSHLNSFTLVPTTEHYDVGNFNNYYATCARLKTRMARAMNTLTVDTFYGTITKRSTTHNDKVQKEKLWYLSLNEQQKLFTPRIVHHQGNGLIMTLEPGVTLADIQVYEDVPDATWSMLIHKIFKIMHGVFYRNTLEKDHVQAALEQVYHRDVVTRLGTLAPDLFPFLSNIGVELYAHANWSSIIHGDLHTGNILFEPSSGKLTLVDPRGEFGTIGSAGDRNYDMYKLFQDLYHGYHFLLHNRPRKHTTIPTILCNVAKEYGYDVDRLIRGGLLLMATCAPFHAEDPSRQKRFLDYVRIFRMPPMATTGTSTHTTSGTYRLGNWNYDPEGGL